MSWRIVRLAVLLRGEFINYIHTLYILIRRKFYLVHSSMRSRSSLVGVCVCVCVCVWRREAYSSSQYWYKSSSLSLLPLRPSTWCHSAEYQVLHTHTGPGLSDYTVSMCSRWLKDISPLDLNLKKYCFHVCWASNMFCFVSNVNVLSHNSNYLAAIFSKKSGVMIQSYFKR